MYPKVRHKNNAAVRAEAAERKRRSRENKQLEQEAILENPALGCDAIWSTNLALISSEERDNLIQIQDETIEIIGCINYCLEVLEAGNPPPVWSDVTYEDARRLKRTHGTYKYSLSKRDIAEIYKAIGRDNPIVKRDEPLCEGNEQRAFLLIGDREYNLFGLNTRLPEDLYHTFIVKIATYLHDLPVPNENFDPVLAADVIKESGINLKDAENDEPDAVLNCWSSKPTDIPPNIPAANTAAATNQIKDIPAFEQNRNFMHRELEKLIGRRV